MTIKNNMSRKVIVLLVTSILFVSMIQSVSAFTWAEVGAVGGGIVGGGVCAGGGVILGLMFGGPPVAIIGGIIGFSICAFGGGIAGGEIVSKIFPQEQALKEISWATKPSPQPTPDPATTMTIEKTPEAKFSTGGQIFFTFSVTGVKTTVNLLATKSEKVGIGEWKLELATENEKNENKVQAQQQDVKPIPDTTATPPKTQTTWKKITSGFKSLFEGDKTSGGSSGGSAPTAGGTTAGAGGTTSGTGTAAPALKPASVNPITKYGRIAKRAINAVGNALGIPSARPATPTTKVNAGSIPPAGTTAAPTPIAATTPPIPAGGNAPVEVKADLPKTGGSVGSTGTVSSGGSGAPIPAPSGGQQPQCDTSGTYTAAATSSSGATAQVSDPQVNPTDCTLTTDGSVTTDSSTTTDQTAQFEISRNDQPGPVKIVDFNVPYDTYDTQLSAPNATRNVLWIILLLAALMGLLVFLVYKYREMKREERELNSDAGITEGDSSAQSSSIGRLLRIGK